MKVIIDRPTLHAIEDNRRYLEKRRLSVMTGRGMVLGRTISIVAIAVVVPIIATTLGGYEARYALTISVACAIAIMGGNIVASTVGDVNLAIGAQMAIGAYSMVFGLHEHLGELTSMIIAVIVSTLVTAVLSVGIVRLQGVYTALATFAFAFAMPDFITFLGSFTGGGSGEYVSGIKIGSETLGDASLLTIYVGMAVFIVVGGLWLRLFASGIGRRLLVLGEADPALAAFGMSSYWSKIALWSVGGVLGGMGGVMYAIAIGYLNPSEFTFYLSLYLFVGGMVGGLSSVMGALIGGLVVGAVPVYLSTAPGSSEYFIFGGLLVVSLLIGGGGVWPQAEKCWLLMVEKIRSTALGAGTVR